MYNAKQAINIILHSSRDKATTKERENIEKAVRSEVNGYISQIVGAIQQPGFQSNLRYVLSKNSRVYTMGADKKVYTVIGASTYGFNRNNYKEVANSCWKRLRGITATTANNSEVVRDFFASYNTLVLLSEVKERLIAQCIAKNNPQEDEKASAQFSRTDMDEAIATLKRIMEDEQSIMRTEGKIVLGKKTLFLSDEETRILSEEGVDVNKIKNIGDNISLSCKTGAVYINCQMSRDTAKLVQNLIRGVFYNNLLSFHSGELLVAYAEKRDDSIGSCTGLLLNELDKYKQQESDFNSCIYKAISDDGKEYSVSRERNEFHSLLKAIDQEQGKRSTLLMGENCESIYVYNQKYPKKQKGCILLLINGFPDNLIVGDGSDADTGKLENIIKNGAKYGIFTLFIGENRAVTGGRGTEEWQLDCNGLGMRNYELEDPNIKWNYVDENKIPEIVNASISANKKYNSLSIENLIEVAEKNFVKPVIGREIAIPFGISEGEPYYFASSTVTHGSKYHGGPHSFIYGKSGKGKTSMVNTLIMSGSYFYSPDELQFYLLDFKASEGNPDYSGYLQNLKNDNSYLPHIKFISVRGDKAFADEVMEMMENLITKRQKQGCEKYDEYCELQRNNPGTIKPLPAIFFMIDEYNAIFNSSNFKLMNKIESLSKRCRQVGIHIVLIGQDVTLDSGSFGEFPNRYSFGADSYSIFASCFSNDREKADITRDAYNIIGSREGMVASNRTSDGAYAINCVQIAYTKDTKPLAKRIRDKWNVNIIQQQGGSSEEVPADWIIHSKQSVDTQNNPEFMNVYDGEHYRFYIGLSALESAPIPIIYGQRLNPEERQEMRCFKNYYINTSEEKQLRVEENAMFSYADYLRTTSEKGDSYCLSFNYCKDWRMRPDTKKLAEETADYIRMSKLSEYIKINDDKVSVLKEIENAYKIYSERKDKYECDAQPYLLTFFNCTWIPFLSSFRQTVESNFSISALNDPDMKRKATKFKAEKGLPDEEILSILREYYPDKMGNQGESSSLDGSSIAEHLDTLIKEGAEFNIFVLIGIDSFEGFGYSKPNGAYKEIISENTSTSKDTCILHNKMVRLFNYHNANEWINDFNKGV